MTAPTIPRATEAQCQAAIIDFATRLGYTIDGSPRHPLYVKADQTLIPFGADT